MHGAKDKFSEAGFHVVFVGLGTAEQAERFRKELSLSYQIICDPDKTLYHMFDLGRATISSIVSPSVLLKGLRALSEGYRPGMPQGDTMQLPGVFLIDTDGNIRYSYFSKDPSDHPSVETLLKLKDMFN